MNLPLAKLGSISSAAADTCMHARRERRQKLRAGKRERVREEGRINREMVNKEPTCIIAKCKKDIAKEVDGWPVA